MSRSPTSIASTPASCSLSASARDRMPLSLTTMIAGGIKGRRRKVVARSTRNVRRSRLLMPTIFGRIASARSRSDSSCTSTSAARPSSAARLVEARQFVSGQRRGDEQDGVRAERARFEQLVVVEDEILLQDRDRHRLARAAQIVAAALEERGVREHGHRGRSGAGIEPRDLRRGEVRADDALARRGSFELRDQPDRAVPPAPNRAGEIPRAGAPFTPFRQVGRRNERFPLLDFFPFRREDFVENQPGRTFTCPDEPHATRDADSGPNRYSRTCPCGLSIATRRTKA